MGDRERNTVRVSLTLTTLGKMQTFYVKLAIMLRCGIDSGRALR